MASGGATANGSGTEGVMYGGDSKMPMGTAGGPSPDTGGVSDTGGVGATGGFGGGLGGGAGGGGIGTTASEAGAPSAGAGGASATSLGECLSCAVGSCASALKGCSDNPECAPWLACVQSCDSAAAASACDARYADAARVYRPVYACLCGANCQDECSAAHACDKSCVDDQRLPPSSVEPSTLADTGLYASKSPVAGALPPLGADVYLYQPQHALWADGAGKDRYIYIPRCSTVDTSDMDHWQFPVGTRLWKHFSLDGKLIETRMMERYGADNADWLFATYGWDPDKPNDPSAAVAVLHGEPDANGTLHDIPDPSACPSCHGKLPEKPLGFSAIELSHHLDGLTMQKLSDWGWLSVPARQGFTVPGTPVQQAALGYLHANCGGCHNSYGEIPRENPMKLRLLVAQTKYADTDTVHTTIGIPTINAYPELHDKPRIDPGSPPTSAIYLRMSDRDKFPMPPLASKFPDTEGGVAAVTAWIDSLAK